MWTFTIVEGSKLDFFLELARWHVRHAGPQAPPLYRHGWLGAQAEDGRRRRLACAGKGSRGWAQMGLCRLAGWDGDGSCSRSGLDPKERIYFSFLIFLNAKQIRKRQDRARKNF
jgi:hypothetical protein